jgi:hypothetical protein
MLHCDVLSKHGVEALEVMFTADERESDALSLHHLKRYIYVVPGSVGIWANLMCFLDESMCIGGEQSG